MSAIRSVVIFCLFLCRTHSEAASILDNSSDLWRNWVPDDEIPSQINPPPARRITAKSVFIVPSFCSEGYRADDNGDCVKIVRVDESAHWNLLLQKLSSLSLFSPPNSAATQEFTATSDQTSTPSESDAEPTTITRGPLRIPIPFPPSQYNGDKDALGTEYVTDKDTTAKGSESSTTDYSSTQYSRYGISVLTTPVSASLPSSPNHTGTSVFNPETVNTSSSSSVADYDSTTSYATTSGIRYRPVAFATEDYTIGATTSFDRMAETTTSDYPSKTAMPDEGDFRTTIRNRELQTTMLEDDTPTTLQDEILRTTASDDETSTVITTVAPGEKLGTIYNKWLKGTTVASDDVETVEPDEKSPAMFPRGEMGFVDDGGKGEEIVKTAFPIPVKTTFPSETSIPDEARRTPFATVQIISPSSGAPVRFPDDDGDGYDDSSPYDRPNYDIFKTNVTKREEAVVAVSPSPPPFLQQLLPNSGLEDKVKCEYEYDSGCGAKLDVKREKKYGGKLKQQAIVAANTIRFPNEAPERGKEGESGAATAGVAATASPSVRYIPYAVLGNGIRETLRKPHGWTWRVAHENGNNDAYGDNNMIRIWPGTPHSSNPAQNNLNTVVQRHPQWYTKFTFRN